jgi:hypothetical protein
LSSFGSSLSDPLRRHALMASLVLHGLVLIGMGAYLLRPNVLDQNGSGVAAANEVVFEFGGIDKDIPVVKPADVKSVPNPTSRVAKPVSENLAVQKQVVQKLAPKEPIIKPTQPKPRGLPNPAEKKDATSRQGPNPNKPARTIKSQAVGLPKSAAANVIKFKAGTPLSTQKPTSKVSDSKPRPSSADEPVQATQPVKLAATASAALASSAPTSSAPTSSAPTSSAPTSSAPARVETGTIGASGPKAGPVAEAPASTSNARTTSTREPTLPASPVATGQTGATQETESVLTSERSSKPVAVRETGLPTLAGLSDASDSKKPKSGAAESSADSGPAGSGGKPVATVARETGPAGTGTNNSNSNTAARDSDPAASQNNQSGASNRETAPTAASGVATAGSNRETGPAMTTSAKTPGSSQESGPGSKSPATTGSSTPETRGPSAAGPAGPSAAGPSAAGSSTSEPQGSGSGAGMAGPAGSKPSGSSAEGTGVSGSSGVGAEKAVRRCAIVIDVRRISPPLRANMSPAILDPNGRKIWPDANAVQDVESDLVNETGIASFVASPQAALSLLVPGVNPLEVRAVGTAMAEGVKDSSVRDYVVVSLADAQRIVTLGKNCQVVFVK